MFYLLEDNRIIDSENMNNGCEIFSISSNDVGEPIITIRIINDIIVRVKYKIKKQSENVFDLIEKGDLVKVDVNRFCPRPQLIFDVNSIFTYDNGIKEFAIMDMSFTEKKILSIYKPNANGDYIKVWERKEE